MLDEICHNVAITFSNIRKYAIGVDFGSPCECLVDCVQQRTESTSLSYLF